MNDAGDHRLPAPQGPQEQHLVRSELRELRRSRTVTPKYTAHSGTAAQKQVASGTQGGAAGWDEKHTGRGGVALRGLFPWGDSSVPRQSALHPQTPGLARSGLTLTALPPSPLPSARSPSARAMT